MNIEWRFKRWLRNVPLVETALKLRTHRPLMRNPVVGVVPTLERAVSGGFVDGSFEMISGAQSVARLAPSSRGSVDPLFRANEKVVFPLTGVGTLNLAEIYGFSVLGDGKWLIGDVSCEPGMDRENPSNHSFMRQYWVPRPIELSKDWIVLSCSWAHQSYYHWMLDLLPRLSLLEQAGRWKKGQSRSFLINSARYAFQKETLARLGISSWVESEGHSFVAPSLICPSMPGDMGKVPGWVPRYLKERLGNAGLDSNLEVKKCIYISRGNAPSRRIRNEAHVKKYLEQRGFQTIHAEYLSFSDQVKIFQGASVIVAPHGGGLTNLCFSEPGTSVIELFGSNYVNPCYWTLAEACGHEYRYLIEDGVRNPNLAGPGTVKDYNVNIEYLDNEINDLPV